VGEAGENDAAGLTERQYHLTNADRGVTLAKRVRVAGDSNSRRKGLLGTSELDQDSALWIYPCEAIHTFGMKFPIDVIFLDGDFRVRKIHPELGPNRICFCLSASSVVELPVGTISASGTKVNDKLEFT
jgi:uncharacterized membrane protein (UPF0127 family)